MLIRKITIINAIIMMISLVLIFNVNPKIANASNEKYQDLIGEWSAVWPGNRGDRSTIVIHEVDEEKSKARITYIVDRFDEGHKEYEIDADFITEPPPTLKFNVRGSDFTCVFTKGRKKLDVSFVGQ